MIAKIVKMDGELEDCTAYGDTLMYSGVKLAPAFGGTGYDENVRYFQDFGSRLYLLEE
jgi:alpha-galactosidase